MGAEPAYVWPDESTQDARPNAAYELFSRGTAFLESGHPGQAALFLARAAALLPDKTSIREALGRAYYALGRFDRAADEFATITERAPCNDYAHFGLGCSLLRLGHPLPARGSLRLALAMRPGHGDYARRLEEAERLLSRPRP